MPKEESWTPLPWDLNITQRGNVEDYVVCHCWLMHICTYARRIRAETRCLFWCGVGSVCKYGTLTHTDFNEDTNLWEEYKQARFISLLTAAACAELNSRCKG